MKVNLSLESKERKESNKCLFTLAARNSGYVNTGARNKKNTTDKLDKEGMADRKQTRTG